MMLNMLGNGGNSASQKKEQKTEACHVSFGENKSWPGDIPPAELLTTWIVWEGENLYVSEEIKPFNPHLVTYLTKLDKRQIKYVLIPTGVKKFGEIRRKYNAGVEQSTTIVEREIRAYLDLAVEYRASDIHMDTYEDHATIKFRIDGRMKVIQEIRAELAKTIIRVIFQTWLDVSQTSYVHTENQSGRFDKDKLPKGVQGIRLETGPHHQGQFLALRLLWSHEQIKGDLATVLTTLGYSDANARALSAITEKPSGLNIMSGPTGSGKTTSLKYILEAQAANRPDLQITTIEDPPESIIQGARQLKVTKTEKEEREDAFEKLIRSVLRANPNTLMVGEVRGPRTAGLVIDAAMTGHQMFTTIHAMSSFDILERLSRQLSKFDGCPPQESLIGLCHNAIISSLTFQRLSPVLCENCKKRFIENYTDYTPGRILGLLATFNPEEAEDIYLSYKESKNLEPLLSTHQKCLDPLYVKSLDGCEECRGTGVHGRTVLAEVVLTDLEIFEWVKKGGISYARQEWLRDTKRHGENGGQTLQSHARQKVAQGLLDPLLTEHLIGRLFSDQFLEDSKLEGWEVDLMGML